MNTEIITAAFPNPSEVRIVPYEGGARFIAKDVCDILSIQNVSQALQALDEDERGICSTYTPGGTQEMLYVTESGLYTLILRCREATNPGTPAHKFKRWITHEVIPAIRKHGCYPPPTTQQALPLSFPEHLQIDGIPASSIAKVFTESTVKADGNILKVKELRPTFTQAIPGMYWSTRRLHKHLTGINAPIIINRNKCPVIQGFALAALI
jgi:prophage antirepressor-like protein